MTPLITCFAALSDPTRLAIVERLMEAGECSAGSLVSRTDLTAPAVSRHLRVLRQAGLVNQRIEGTKRMYAVRPEGLRLIWDWSISRREFWDKSLDRLEAAIARQEEQRND